MLGGKMVQDAAFQLLHWNSPLDLGLTGFTITLSGGPGMGLYTAKWWLKDYLRQHSEPDLLVFCLGRLEVLLLDTRTMWRLVKSILRYYKSACPRTVLVWSNIPPVGPFEFPKITRSRHTINTRAALICDHVLQHGNLTPEATAWNEWLIQIFNNNLFDLLCDFHWWWGGPSAFGQWQEKI